MKTPETNTLHQIESLNMERQNLLNKTSKFKDALEEQVSGLKQDTMRLAVQGLVFAGVALGSYLLIRAFKKKDKDQDRNYGQISYPKSDFASSLFASIQGYIITFLLSIAREKITEYLESKLTQSKHAPSENFQ
jgi:hypothetical protein